MALQKAKAIKGYNTIPYEHTASSANPRLLILLSDESEESVKLVNYLIDRTILLILDGDAPKNRCFISVIGYNHSVNELCSGWLRELDSSLYLRMESHTKKVPDGAGGFVEVDVKQPVWVESAEQQISIDKFDRAIHFAKELSLKWSEDNSMSPIVIDCSKVCHAEYAKEEIGHLKAITTKDGNVFFGCYSKKDDVFEIFSKMPKEWEYKFQRWDLKEEDYINGLLNYEHIGSIFSAMMEVGGMAFF